MAAIPLSDYRLTVSPRLSIYVGDNRTIPTSSTIAAMRAFRWKSARTTACA
jgi:hypothetical protein